MIQAIVWGVGVDVRRRDVALGPDDDADLGRVAPGQALELALRELLGIDDHAALAAAVRDADDRALPGHPHRQRLDLVEGHVLVVADAALGRAAAEVVLDAVAGEDLDAAVVHVHREVDGQLAARLAQHAAQARVEVEPVGGQVELLLGHFPRVDGPAGGSFGCHGGFRLPRGSTSRLPDDPTVATAHPRSTQVDARRSVNQTEYSPESLTVQQPDRNQTATDGTGQARR